MRRSEAEQGQVQGNAPVSSKPRSAPPLRIGWNKLSACNVVDNRADRWSMYDDLSLIPNTIGSFTLKVMIRSQVPLLLLKVLFPIHRGVSLSTQAFVCEPMAACIRASRNKSWFERLWLAEVVRVIIYTGYHRTKFEGPRMTMLVNIGHVEIKRFTTDSIQTPLDPFKPALSLNIYSNIL